MEPVNPEDELFWHKVREAFDLINRETNQIVVELGNKQAIVELEKSVTGDDIVVIEVSEIKLTPPTLVVP